MNFPTGVKMCCVDFISLFKYFSFEFVCACVVRTKKRSRVFIIFIDAIINDWCLFVWAVSALAICMLCACTRENLHFWFLLFDHAQCVEWSEKMNGKNIAFCSFIMNHKTRLCLAKKRETFEFCDNFPLLWQKKSNNIMPKREGEGGVRYDSYGRVCVLKRNKWENFRQNWWQRQKKQLRINGKNKRNETRRFNSDGTSFSVRRKIRFVSWKMSLFQWV